jgi:hypothetical protein
VQWGLDPIHFADATEQPARHISVADYSFDDPINFNNHAVIYYRLKWLMTGSNQVYYSPIRTIYGEDSAVNLISFDATLIGHQSVLNTWNSYLDGFTDHFVLERTIGDGSYTTIDNHVSQHHYGQQYNFIDQHLTSIATGALIHYRLTAVLQDGTKIVLPEKTVEWINANTYANIYPNPAHDGRFTIAWFADAGTNMAVHITDALGRSVYETAVTSTQWSNTSTLQTANHTGGVYFVRMDIGGSRYVAKLVFE